MFVISYSNGTSIQKVCRRTNHVADAIVAISQLNYTIIDVEELS